jgi:hypothetical protein
MDFKIQGEPCGQVLNPGCNSDPPRVSPMSCGDRVHGTLRADAGSRDVDFYECTLDQETEVRLTLTSEVPTIAGFLRPAPPGCGGAEGLGEPAAVLDCQSADASATLPAGTYWLFVSTGTLEASVFFGLPL